MDHADLVRLLLRRSAATAHECTKVSATRFVPTDVWQSLRPHEREYLRCYAAALSAHRAVLVSRSAARVSGIWVMPTREEVIELGARGGGVPSKSQWPERTVYMHGQVPGIDVRTLDALGGSGEEPRIRLTARARTAVDIARVHGVRHGVVAMDSLYRLEAGVPDALESTLDRLAGKRGIAQARNAYELSTHTSESPFESLMRVMFIEDGIEAEPQMWIGPKVRVDFLWGQLVIEIDGYMKFDDKPHEAVMAQLKRENWIKEQGYEVIRLFTSEILRDPAGCIARIRAMKLIADTRPAPAVKATNFRPAR